ncbi:hypothetical protein NA57DRAFT_56575 [Rhizodiscina lignyota]|uniref:SET domain-containing protein n=1 Tax=Rhizodiscina lignyota TaxID=1504668 RepID=A0A9P4IIT0_9PEZI|nr:hypothetical protein NA57DRAFT_56575 [Rhizodiscina lignyota]
MSTENSFFEINDSPLGGVGVFAKADIPRGMRVLAELPLLRGEHGLAPAQVLRDFKNLSTSEKASFLSLHHNESESPSTRYSQATGREWGSLPPAVRKILAICQTNSFGIDNSIIGRITYIDLNISRIQRREALRFAWGFECKCFSCTNVEAGVADLKIYLEEQRLAGSMRLGTREDWNMSLESLRKIAELAASEGLFSKLHYAASCSQLRPAEKYCKFFCRYGNATGFCLKLRDRREALQWAEKALDYARCSVGEDRPGFPRLAHAVLHLRKMADRSGPLHPAIYEHFLGPVRPDTAEDTSGERHWPMQIIPIPL